MSEEASFASPDAASGGPNIQVGDDASVQQWAKKLNVTAQQIHDAVKAVGNSATDVEEHLKGSRATTNAETTKAAGAGAPANSHQG